MATTGHFAHLLTEGMDDLTLVSLPAKRTTTTSRIFIVAVPEIKYEDLPLQTMSIHHAIFASFPILVSFSTCILCALCADWYCFAMILLGIISSGVTCFVIGSGALGIETVTKPADGSPSGDGILLTHNGVVILKGEEKDVNAITKGKFSLKLKGAPEYTVIGLCSLLLELQFLLQLLLIPQGSLFGQVMFLTSVGKLQRKLFCDTIKLRQAAMLGFEAGTRTSMAAFTCFVLCENLPRPLEDIKPIKILLEFLPNETLVWRKWREQVMTQVQKKEGEASIFQPENVDMSGLDATQQLLLTTLLQDADDAYKGYIEYRDRRLSINVSQAS
ncbi:hypothetical protein BDR07DRAFT_1442714 [Suillus spraguei]|nr:hypothetical protein BDR07DRAFT_1442714 [Suillus spraguei]